MITRINGTNFTTPMFKTNIATVPQKIHQKPAQDTIQFSGNNSQYILDSDFIKNIYHKFQNEFSKTEISEACDKAVANVAKINLSELEIKMEKATYPFKSGRFSLKDYLLHDDCDKYNIYFRNMFKNTTYYYENGNKAADIKEGYEEALPTLKQVIGEYYNKNGVLKYKKYISTEYIRTEVYKDDGKTLDYTIFIENCFDKPQEDTNIYIVKDDKYILNLKNNNSESRSNSEIIERDFYEISNQKASLLEKYKKGWKFANSILSRYVKDEFDLSGLDKENVLLPLLEDNMDLLSEEEIKNLEELYRISAKLIPNKTWKYVNESYTKYTFNRNFLCSFFQSTPKRNEYLSIKPQNGQGVLYNTIPKKHLLEMANIATDMRRKVFEDELIFKANFGISLFGNCGEPVKPL